MLNISDLPTSELAWSHHTGRDSDGDRFSHYVYYNLRTGRVLAKVYEPLGDGYACELAFFYGAGYTGRKLDAVAGQYRFLGTEKAQEFVERTVERLGTGKAE